MPYFEIKTKASSAQIIQRVRSTVSYSIPFDEQALLRAASDYGTPTYVYSEAEIMRRCSMLMGLFPKDLPVSWLYAMKANDNPHLLELVANAGFGFDTVSSEEMHLGLMFQRSARNIFYTENNMTDAEMDDAAAMGVVLNIGSISRLRKYAASYPGTSVSIRVKPDIGDGHHSKVITGNEDSKFGIRIDAIEEALSIAKRSNVTITGIHVHIGSGIKEPENFYMAMRKLLSISRLFPDLQYINFGGGLPIPYKEGEPEFDLRELRELAEPLLRNELKFRNGALSFLFEPGRYIMAQGGVLLTTVTSVKDQGPRTYLGCDTGFNHLVRPVLYDAWHEVVNVSRITDPVDHIYTLAGNICESGDLLAENRALPATYEGDVLALADAGAYGMVMASEYNRRRLPAEVMVCSNGSIKQIRKRDRIRDVLERHLKNCNYPVQPILRES
jgi:diaminopimelate decarboxylase